MITDANDPIVTVKVEVPHSRLVSLFLALDFLLEDERPWLVPRIYLLHLLGLRVAYDWMIYDKQIHSPSVNLLLAGHRKNINHNREALRHWELGYPNTTSLTPLKDLLNDTSGYEELLNRNLLYTSGEVLDYHATVVANLMYLSQIPNLKAIPNKENFEAWVRNHGFRHLQRFGEPTSELLKKQQEKLAASDAFATPFAYYSHHRNSDVPKELTTLRFN